MAEDCICTNLFSIYSVLNDIATSLRHGSSGIGTINNNNLSNIRNSINALATSIGTLNDVVSKLDELFKCSSLTIACILKSSFINDLTSRPWLEVVHTDLSNINAKFQYDDKSIAEIWSYKEMCVSNETIVESPLSTYVSKGLLEFNDV